MEILVRHMMIQPCEGLHLIYRCLVFRAEAVKKVSTVVSSNMVLVRDGGYKSAFKSPS